MVLTELQDLWQDLQSNKFFRPAVGVLAVGLLGTAGWHAYQWHNRRKQEAAQELFSEALVEFERATMYESDQGVWSEVAEGFERGAERAAGSSLNPYFKTFEASALVEQDNVDKALGIMADAVYQMPASSPVYHLYKTKYALMLLDASSDAQRDEGLALLKELAKLPANENRDVALFYLGQYYAQQQNYEEARSWWTELLTYAETANAANKDQDSSMPSGMSPFARMAQVHLESLKSL